MAVVGIDFGSKHTTVAVVRNTSVDIIFWGSTNNAIPSVVAFGPEGMSYGESANPQQLGSQQIIVSCLVRLVGQPFKSVELKEEQRYISAPLVDVGGQVGIEVPWQGKARRLTATQVAAIFLHYVKARISAELGKPVDAAVISCPVWFTVVQRRGLLCAAELAGLNVLRIFDDTTAAALNYGIERRDLPTADRTPHRTAFIDFGSSKTTCAMVHFSKGELKVQYAKCNRHYGLRNLDQNHLRGDSQLHVMDHYFESRISDSDSIELIGGGSKVAAIVQSTRDFFGSDKVSSGSNGDEVVARGCALMCAILSPKFRVREFSVYDTNGNPIEVLFDPVLEVNDNHRRLLLFPSGNPVPSTKILTFYRKKPFSLAFQYEYTAALPGINMERSIGHYLIEGVRPNSAGDFMICKVKVRINLNGILTVDAAYYVEEQDVEEQGTSGTQTSRKQVHAGDLSVTVQNKPLDESTEQTFNINEFETKVQGRVIDTVGASNRLESKFEKLTVEPPTQQQVFDTKEYDSPEYDDSVLSPPSGIVPSAAWKDINGMVGLSEVKQQIARLVSTAYIQKKYNLKKSKNTGLHMVFSGNPGCGKTTVARLMAAILRDIGVLPQGHLVETNRSSLVGTYVGDAEKNIQAKIAEAQGGVLFLDEAHHLIGQEHGYNPGKDIINTLYPPMDNQKDSFVVIFATYPEFVDPFMAMDPGLKRRIRHIIKFPDYSDDELAQVLQNQVHDSERFCLEDGLCEFVAASVGKKRGSEGFGNAAAITAALETAIEQWSLRAMRLRREKQPDTSSSGKFILQKADFLFEDSS